MENLQKVGGEFKKWVEYSKQRWRKPDGELSTESILSENGLE